MKMKAGLVTFFGSGKAQSINLAVPTYIYCTTHTQYIKGKKIQSSKSTTTNTATSD